MYYVYVLVSEKDGKRYIGMTPNIIKRLEKHNNGLVTSTKYRTPFQLIHSEKYETKNEAANRERFFKSGQGRAYLKSIGI